MTLGTRSMPQRLTIGAALIGLSILLTACGFQLRGSTGTTAALPENWKTMYLVTGNPNSEFTRAVRTVFVANGITWADRDDANFMLKLGPERFTRTNLSLNQEARVSQLELTMRSTFSVVAENGDIAMPENMATVTRRMDNDPRNEQGMGEEVRILQVEMRNELAQQIIRRIGFFATAES
ncbi:MAG: LPS assembly lipoprotein LptE [Pseudomonadota bacterium]